MSVGEINVRKVECLKMRKIVKGTVRMNITFNAFTAKVETYHITRDGVTGDTMPRTAISPIFPCCCFQKTKFITRIIINSYGERGLELKQSRALIMMA
ncbi:hypothetical protein L195_g043132 [Trifolium pratense]|uniref:Uncharacterized protein n=1 Tax=Trifolium pratense TaxID=57577 RepID=A0A2K3M8D1_TRIPR|nr:hypothetical protein L195_g043132 [Trifolium pratense]